MHLCKTTVGMSCQLICIYAGSGQTHTALSLHVRVADVCWGSPIAGMPGRPVARARAYNAAVHASSWEVIRNDDVRVHTWRYSVHVRVWYVHVVHLSHDALWQVDQLEYVNCS